MPQQQDAMSLLNALPPQRARAELLRCCTCNRWADEVLRHMPFSSESQARNTLDACWAAMGPQEWLEAFSAHPRIGAGGGDHKKPSGWEAEEQKGAATAGQQVLQGLREWNRKYDDKFGFVFLICATGKSADEMLAALRARYHHHASTEMAVAAEEHRKITQIRFTKLLAGLQDGQVSRL
ncbi:putative OHCU decarboxylase [Tribonema minus]|uniref:2-oxo-4-hydroxy-4-carboxy-5-ureidoimidazoline decarboxylase n=1 Tax=Tribonema minus TaxID=303371 RepID=A0A835YUP2_9STRA|nr:putative OHCU decarboxylase [Tribonema minus]